MITGLYRTTLRTAQSFNSYNFRNYFLRRTHDVFRTMQSETNADKLRSLFQEANAELAVIRRSAIVNQIYGGPKLVIEATLPEQEGVERSVL
ncbi:hypothetical protein E1B28_009183 [Marasmius oreades]|uniref:Complex 1 LYR protein domain-containing protein n=1 Tax=Marasmius oreades TaxID=181124 RepID=A0A9P7S168_9AGAR|nr:uncharacterized protein E1B28_009183 [Marasmius oreades]KAG7092871.1 hypothetical protein E1B28_009183 [Marasmius oreades]